MAIYYFFYSEIFAHLEGHVAGGIFQPSISDGSAVFNNSSDRCRFPKCGRGFWAILIGKTRIISPQFQSIVSYKSTLWLVCALIATRFTRTETKSELVFKNIYWKLNMMYRSRVYIKKKIMIINTCCTESWKKQTVMGPCLSMGHNTVFVQATKIFIFITVFLCCFT